MKMVKPPAIGTGGIYQDPNQITIWWLPLEILVTISHVVVIICLQIRRQERPMLQDKNTHSSMFRPNYAILIIVSNVLTESLVVPFMVVAPASLLCHTMKVRHSESSSL